MNGLISRQAAIDALKNMYEAAEKWGCEAKDEVIKARAESCMASLIEMKLRIEKLPSAEPSDELYEYHYDHTDCIWYRPEARNRCPITCAQYRDGWNDAMNYIFRDGKGYRPYKRDKQYGE